MQLSDKRVEKYRELMKSNFNKDLSIGEARDGLLKLVLLVKGAYKPMSREELDILLDKEENYFIQYLDFVFSEEEPESVKEEESCKDSY